MLRQRIMNKEPPKMLLSCDDHLLLGMRFILKSGCTHRETLLEKAIFPLCVVSTGIASGLEMGAYVYFPSHG